MRRRGPFPCVEQVAGQGSEPDVVPGRGDVAATGDTWHSPDGLPNLVDQRDDVARVVSRSAAALPPPSPPRRKASRTAPSAVMNRIRRVVASASKRTAPCLWPKRILLPAT